MLDHPEQPRFHGWKKCPLCGFCKKRFPVAVEFGTPEEAEEKEKERSDRRRAKDSFRK